jgi:hypothetical protein
MTFKAAHGSSAPDVVLASPHIFASTVNFFVGNFESVGKGTQDTLSDHAPVWLQMCGEGEGNRSSRQTGGVQSRKAAARFNHAAWRDYAAALEVGDASRCAAALVGELGKAPGAASNAVDGLACMLKECVTESMPPARMGSDEWWNSDCEAGRVRLSQALKRASRCRDVAQAAALKKAARREYKLLLRARKCQWSKDLSKRMLEQFRQDPRGFWRQLEGLRAPCVLRDVEKWRGHFDNLLCGDGQVGVDCSAADSFFSKLHNVRDWRTCAKVRKRQEDAAELNAAFTVGEVQAVLRDLCDHKASDPSGVVAELLKYAVLEYGEEDSVREGTNLLAPSLCVLFNYLLETGSYPLSMCMNDLVPVFKKGDAKQMGN